MSTDGARVATAIGEQLHLQTRRPRTTVMLLVGAGVIAVASEQLPIALAVTSTPLRIFLALYAVCLVGAAATISRGVRHPTYLAFNCSETLLLTTGVGLLIVSGGTPHSLLWLLYFSTVLHGATAALYRRFNYVAFAVAPLVIALGFVCRADTAAAVLSLLLGATALYLHRLVLAATDRRNAIEADRERLRQRLSELAVVEERERIARDLHDGLGANLTAAIWQARRTPDVPAIAALEQRLMACLDDLGALVWATRREDRTMAAMWSLLRARCDDLFGEEVQLGYSLPEVSDALLIDGDTAVTVLFIVFEALRNAVRHARATTVHVSGALDAGVLEVEIVDDGVGFDPATAVAGHGLLHMEERAVGTGGTFEVRSSPGRTWVRARIPLRPPALATR